MRRTEYLKTTGVYVPADVVDAIAAHLSAEGGVTEYRSYFTPQQSKLPRGDPGGELTNCILQCIDEQFTELYDRADFSAAQTVDADAFELMTVASETAVVVGFKEKVRAAATIQNTDSRTIHTAIFRAFLDSQPLPDLPEEFIFHES